MEHGSPSATLGEPSLNTFWCCKTVSTAHCRGQQIFAASKILQVAVVPSRPLPRIGSRNELAISMRSMAVHFFRLKPHGAKLSSLFLCRTFTGSLRPVYRRVRQHLGNRFISLPSHTIHIYSPCFCNHFALRFQGEHFICG